MGLVRSIPHLLVENGSQICGTKVYDSAYETPATFVLFTWTWRKRLFSSACLKRPALGTSNFVRA